MYKESYVSQAPNLQEVALPTAAWVRSSHSTDPYLIPITGKLIWSLCCFGISMLVSWACLSTTYCDEPSWPCSISNDVAKIMCLKVLLATIHTIIDLCLSSWGKAAGLEVMPGLSVHVDSAGRITCSFWCMCVHGVVSIQIHLTYPEGHIPSGNPRLFSQRRLMVWAIDCWCLSTIESYCQPSISICKRWWTTVNSY